MARGTLSVNALTFRIICSGASIAAQAQLPSLQGHRDTYYAGAWTAYGFHEDGIRSAVAVVEAMGGSLPWVPR